MKLLLIFSLLFVYELQAFKRAPKIYKKEFPETRRSYILPIQPLFTPKDETLLQEHKILDFNTFSDLNRLYLWTTPTNIIEENVKIEVNSTLEYPMYCTFSSDNRSVYW